MRVRVQVFGAIVSEVRAFWVFFPPFVQRRREKRQNQPKSAFSRWRGGLEIFGIFARMVLCSENSPCFLVFLYWKFLEVNWRGLSRFLCICHIWDRSLKQMSKRERIKKWGLKWVFFIFYFLFSFGTNKKRARKSWKDCCQHFKHVFPTPRGAQKGKRHMCAW